MTDRAGALLVVLEHDLREDDPELQSIVTCIGRIRGVASVRRKRSDLIGEAVGESRERARCIALLCDLHDRIAQRGKP